MSFGVIACLPQRLLLSLSILVLNSCVEVSPHVEGTEVCRSGDLMPSFPIERSILIPYTLGSGLVIISEEGQVFQSGSAIPEHSPIGIQNIWYLKNKLFLFTVLHEPNNITLAPHVHVLDMASGCLTRLTSGSEEYIRAVDLSKEENGFYFIGTQSVKGRMRTSISHVGLDGELTQTWQIGELPGKPYILHVSSNGKYAAISYGVVKGDKSGVAVLDLENEAVLHLIHYSPGSYITDVHFVEKSVFVLETLRRGTLDRVALESGARENVLTLGRDATWHMMAPHSGYMYVNYYDGEETYLYTVYAQGQVTIDRIPNVVGRTARMLDPHTVVFRKGFEEGKRPTFGSKEKSMDTFALYDVRTKQILRVIEVELPTEIMRFRGFYTTYTTW